MLYESSEKDPRYQERLYLAKHTGIAVEKLLDPKVLSTDEWAKVASSSRILDKLSEDEKADRWGHQ